VKNFHFKYLIICNIYGLFSSLDSVRQIDQLSHFHQEVSERIVQLEQEEEEYLDWLQYDIKRRALLRLILQQDGTRYERKLLEVIIIFTYLVKKF